MEDDNAAQQWIEKYEKEGEAVMYKDAVAQWNYNTNLTDYNEEIMVISAR